MAEPQLEKGYTRVANELIEALAKINLSAYESRVLWAIIRLTYGWQRKKAKISLGHLNELTLIPRKKISLVLKRLESRTILLIDRKRRGLTIQIQKNYELWGRNVNLKYQSWSYLGQDSCPVCGRHKCKLEQHHIYPKKWGGGNNKGNTIYICYRCHFRIHQWLDQHFELSPQQLYDTFCHKFLSPLFRGQQNGEVSLIEGQKVSPIEGQKLSPTEGTHKRNKEIKEKADFFLSKLNKKQARLNRTEFDRRRQSAIKALMVKGE